MRPLAVVCPGLRIITSGFRDGLLEGHRSLGGLRRLGRLEGKLKPLAHLETLKLYCLILHCTNYYSSSTQHNTALNRLHCFQDRLGHLAPAQEAAAAAKQLYFYRDNTALTARPPDVTTKEEEENPLLEFVSLLFSSFLLGKARIE